MEVPATPTLPVADRAVGSSLFGRRTEPRGSRARRRLPPVRSRGAAVAVGMAFGRLIRARRPLADRVGATFVPVTGMTPPSFLHQCAARPPARTWRRVTRLGPAAELLPAHSPAPPDPPEAELELGLGGNGDSRLDEDLDTPIWRVDSSGHSSSDDGKLPRGSWSCCWLKDEEQEGATKLPPPAAQIQQLRGTTAGLGPPLQRRLPL
jgi:hypothetical protein